jgi:hypothetical protein
MGPHDSQAGSGPAEGEAMSDNMIRIETGIPLPERYFKYDMWPYKQLKPNESFIFTLTPETGSIDCFRQALCQYAKRNKREFITRKIASNQWRVWRTK